MLEPIIPVAPVRKTRLMLAPVSSGSWASMADTSAGSSGVTCGRKRPTTLPSGRHEELLEVPLHVAGLAVGVGGLLELGEERVLLGAVHVDLLEQRELHVVGGVAEVADLLGGAGLLTHELVAGEAEHLEAARPVLLVQLLEALVLRGEAALRGDVHHQERLALVLRQVGGLALERVDLLVVDRS